MSRLKVIIADDEANVRELLALKLNKLSIPVEIKAMCSDAATTLEQLLLQKPDLLFLDIQMTGKSGLDLLQTMRKANITTQVVLVTAFTNIEYFRTAIQWNVADYLVKPVIQEELEAAVEKVVENLKTANKEEKRVATRYEFSCATGRLYLKQEQIVYVKAEGNYSRIWLTDKKQELITESLKQLEDKFNGSSIFRADRSHLINREYVQKIVTGSNRCCFITSLGIAPVVLNETGVKNLLK